MADPASLTTIGSSAFKMGMNVGMMILVVVVVVVFGGGAYFLMKKYKDAKKMNINAIIHHPDGSITTSKCGKYNKGGIDKIIFKSSKETMPVIDPKYIKNKHVELYRYGVGQYAVIPPKMWTNIDLNKFNIELIDMQMKNFVFLEQRAAVSRWAFVKDQLQKLAPFIVALLVLIFAGVVIYFIMKMALQMFGQVTAQRMADCASFFSGTSFVTPTPVGG
jgi:hypothetical protein